MDCVESVFVLVTVLVLLLVEVVRPSTFKRGGVVFIIGERLMYIALGVIVMWVLIHNPGTTHGLTPLKIGLGMGMFFAAFWADNNVHFTTAEARLITQIGQRLGYTALSAWALFLFH